MNASSHPCTLPEQQKDAPFMSQKKIYQRKILMLGSFAVGKTSLVHKYVKRLFEKENYLTTVGVKVDKKIVEFDDQDIMLMIWDMAGEETLTKTHKLHLGGASGYLLVADGTRNDTLKHAQDIQKAVEKIHHKIPFILIINKTDLTAEWDIKEQDIEALKREGWKIVKSSAKTGEGVDDAFQWMARMVKFIE
jgi:small GTP-binding protein